MSYYPGPEDLLIYIKERATEYGLENIRLAGDGCGMATVAFTLPLGSYTEVHNVFDAMANSPHTRALIAQYEEQLNELKKYKVFYDLLKESGLSLNKLPDAP